MVPGSSLQDHIGSSWLIFPAKTLSLGFSLLLDGNGISWDMKTLKIPLEILDICVARKEPQVFFSVIFSLLYRSEVGCSFNTVDTGMGQPQLGSAGLL